MLKKLIALGVATCLVFSFSTVVKAKEYKEGIDYEIRADVKSEKPEIREFFSFFCGHCFMMREQFSNVKEYFKGKADFIMNPVYVLGGDIGVYSETAYAVAKVAGVEEEFSADLFKAIHIDNEEPQNLDYFIKKLEEVGVPADKAMQSYNSFVVKGLVASWDKMVEYAKIEAVPEIMINGRYVVKMDDIDSVQDLNDVISYLLTLN